ncbi:looped-hinge helix DNA binding domain-containing protein, AbrB family [Nitrosomonas ureae]|uniref:Looped-hinge helix DNA binding domain-containing protein, AbrB family n=1 Tax=Nitrosomonas ureae TaxID=44577 RepID=A0A286ALG6_9PROT|nr:AbrB/MazE/SpoVT family DNA-binding domain-containing protein [Nitrosomonas ureae]SOD22719.1 looped-hinge helix DNA binding domain-containing protein, AbrB family [Nitrosomonas ureae]
MSTAKITSKGQITIPIEIRTLLDLQNGDKVNFIVSDSGQVNFIPVTKILPL